MYCENCGSEIKEGSKFCPKCGEPTPPTDVKPPAQKNNSRWRLFLILAIVVVAAVIVAIVFGVRSSRKIDLNKFVTVEFAGYEGYGTANVSVDWASLSKKYDQRMTLSQSEWGLSYNSFSDLLEDCVQWVVEPESNLSNGDEVTLSWDVDTMDLEAAVEKSVTISAEPKTYKVSDLEELGTFDAFEGISVEFSGASPQVRASLEKSDDVPDLLIYTLDSKTGLEIGDTVTVTIDEETAQDYARESGLLPEELSKSFSVENVAYYVSSLDQIPEDGMDKMKAHAENEFNAFVEQDWNVATLTSLDYLGSYFLYSKSNDNSIMNIEYLIYRYQADQSGETVTGYWYCGFENGTILADGTFSVDYDEYYVPSYGNTIWWGMYGEYFEYTDASGESANYIGYSDLDSMFDMLVTGRVDDYTYEATVEEGETGGSGKANTEADDTEGETGTEESTAASEKITEVSASATSYLPDDEQGHSYAPSNLFDGSLSTAYVEDAEGVGIGEELTISLGGEYVIDKIVWSPGYQKSADILAKNGYPTKLTFYFSDGTSVVSTVSDAPTMEETQTVEVDGDVVAESIRVVIDDAVAGYKYDDTCISEMEIYGHKAS